MRLAPPGCRSSSGWRGAATAPADDVPDRPVPRPVGRNPRAVSPRPSASRSVDLPCRAPTFPSISRQKRNSCSAKIPSGNGANPPASCGVPKHLAARPAVPPPVFRPSRARSRSRLQRRSAVAVCVRGPRSRGRRTRIPPSPAPCRSTSQRGQVRVRRSSRGAPAGRAVPSSSRASRALGSVRRDCVTSPAAPRPGRGPAALAHSGCRDGGSGSRSCDPTGLPSLPASRSSPCGEGASGGPAGGRFGCKCPGWRAVPEYLLPRRAPPEGVTCRQHTEPPAPRLRPSASPPPAPPRRVSPTWCCRGRHRRPTCALVKEYPSGQPKPSGGHPHRPPASAGVRRPRAEPAGAGPSRGHPPAARATDDCGSR
jgi:hypothetical protein